MNQVGFHYTGINPCRRRFGRNLKQDMVATLRFLSNSLFDSFEVCNAVNFVLLK